MLGLLYHKFGGFAEDGSEDETGSGGGRDGNSGFDSGEDVVGGEIEVFTDRLDRTGEGIFWLRREGR